ncbi:hypothetical protein UlMin_009873 [Ulmus minor]
MLAGVKFLPRDQIDKDENRDALKKDRKKSSRKEEKGRRKKKSSRHDSSDEELEKIKRGTRKKKWYSSEEYSSESESGKGSSEDEKIHRRKKKSRRSNDDSAGDEASKKSRRRKEKCISEDGGMSDGSREAKSLKEKENARKEIGLEWMLRPGMNTDRIPAVTVEKEPEEATTEEIKVNPRELNPYLTDNGSGYPEEKDEPKAGSSKLLSSTVVGDGGASWRLKALKRAQEQAAREGKKLDEVVEERWGSLGQLTVSVASKRAAPSRAHLNAIKSRQRGHGEENKTSSENQTDKDGGKTNNRDYLKDVSVRVPRLKEPKARDSLSWRKRENQNVFSRDAGVISDAVSGLNKFSNNGNFMREVLQKQRNNCDSPLAENAILEHVSSKTSEPSETSALVKDSTSANQLAAKALQLRMKGKHEEAEKLLQEVEKIKAQQGRGDNMTAPRAEETSRRYVRQDTSARRKKNEDDADMHLASKIMQNKLYSMSGRADDEYDFDDGPSKKSKKKRGGNDQDSHRKTQGNRFLTQQERCIFCFENPKRPSHLVVAIANYTYLMLPQWEPVAPGHCCILPMEHVPSTRSADEYVWQEIRNFKKSLIRMFAKQEKDVVFLETVMNLSQQRRHCLVECIPLPRDIAKEAPLYFKKAIDEAEDEWSQHNAKKLIDTSVKGLRGSIPTNFPYFHVEFGLDRGFVHVIDDEKQFNSSLGLNVIRGMLELPEEDMYRRRRYESVEGQKQAVQIFARDWEPFDWTKQLDQ